MNRPPVSANLILTLTLTLTQAAAMEAAEHRAALASRDERLATEAEARRADARKLATLMAKNEELAEQYEEVTSLCARLQHKLDAAEQRTKGVLRDKDRHVQEKYDHLRIIHEETQAELQSQLERNESMLSHMVKELSSQVERNRESRLHARRGGSGQRGSIDLDSGLTSPSSHDDGDDSSRAGSIATHRCVHTTHAALPAASSPLAPRRGPRTRERDVRCKEGDVCAVMPLCEARQARGRSVGSAACTPPSLHL